MLQALLPEQAVMTIEPGDIDGLQVERAYPFTWEKDSQVEILSEFIQVLKSL